MKESIKTEVIPKDELDQTRILELERSNDDLGDVITLKIGIHTYSADWLGNLKPFFERAIRLWGEEET